MERPKWVPPRSVKLPSFKQGRVRALFLLFEQAKCRILKLEAGKGYAFSAEEVGEVRLCCFAHPLERVRAWHFSAAFRRDVSR
ncbi:hypothetical protein T4A_4449 [Trichinella pseudospiralis]|uniref:Uncharacterized protein n=1 Tax=Trichinella pseudospiralis TaxID=6337 RepID=A0A0V1EP21_TRIPS|nr:hypothetical protein T4A_4449 [Trichinella pseudospiralis]